MVFFYNAEGDLLSLTPKQTYQGSNKANTIYFVCPTAPTNAVSVAFKLPNGEFTTPYLMQLAEDTGIEQVVDSNGNKYYLWFFELPIAVTSYKGNVTVQFFIATLESTIATQSAVFMVSKGVTYIEPEQGDTYLEILSQLVAIQSQLDEKQDTLVSGENIKTVNGQSLLGEGNIETNADITVDNALSDTSENPVQNKVITNALNGKQGTLTAGENITIVDNVISSTGGGGGGSVTVDSELSLESTNPVQNKVVTEALDGKLDKFEPTYNNTTVVWVVQKGNNGSVYAYTKETSASVKSDVIPITGIGGTLRVGDPTIDAHAVNLSYMNANIGHRYKFTSTNALDMFFGEGTEVVFYHDTKSQFDLETLAQELTGKVIPFVLNYSPTLGNKQVGNGSFYVESVIKNSDDTLTIPFMYSIFSYWVNSTSVSSAVGDNMGDCSFTVEQIY